jgi:hypothetical protein
MLAVDHWCFPIFGVIRSDVLKDTPLHGSYFGSDRNLLAELCLHGKLYEVPEYLFFRRDHPAASTSLETLNHWERLVSYNPTGSSQTRFLAARRIYEYAASIYRSPLRISESLLCYLTLLQLIIEKIWRRLLKVVMTSPFRKSYLG